LGTASGRNHILDIGAQYLNERVVTVKSGSRMPQASSTVWLDERGTGPLALMNASKGKSDSLLSFIARAARTTTENGARRQVYILTCYFDPSALRTVTANIRDSIKQVGGTITGVTVAVDVGQWIRRRVSTEELERDLANAAGVALNLVRVVPVQFSQRLLHAKAYAAVGPERTVRKGFLVVTSGNATLRGLGLDDASNLELAVSITQQTELANFEKLIRELVKKSVSERKAMQHDRFLRAIALFCSGTFYHKWQGSLGSEIRFKLTLTDAGKKAKRRGEMAFSEYQPDSDTVSRDPLKIESIFQKIPRPFPPRFWAIYSIETLLGQWLPGPVAIVANHRLSEEVAPYVSAVRKRTSAKTVDEVVRQLLSEVKAFKRRGWIEENSSIIGTWRDRVMRFRENEDLIKLRIHPYEPEGLCTRVRSV
jgi:hypothetical protein